MRGGDIFVGGLWGFCDAGLTNVWSLCYALLDNDSERHLKDS